MIAPAGRLRRAPHALRIAAWAGLVALALPALAAIPSAQKVRRAVASANASAKRTQPLLLEVALVSETGEVAATGQGRLDPAGTSRLDLKLADGRTEAHERTGSSYRALRDGAPVERVLELLPPTRLLQAPTDEALQAALIDLGANGDVVELGIEGGRDCWVLGGRDPGPFEANARAALWVDLESRQPVRIDEAARSGEASAVHFRLGPSAVQDGVRFPTWIDVEAAGWPHWRMQIRHVSPAAGGPGHTP
ncbi:MAG TPA: hypothetical protein VMH82_11255 [Myxococcota bacterium]|nr:hypothetical protein [Myxococcota bacterium]